MELVHRELEVARVCSFSSSWEGQVTVNQFLVHPPHPRPTALKLPLLTSPDPSPPVPPTSVSQPHAFPHSHPTTHQSSLLPDPGPGTGAGLMKMTCKERVSTALTCHQGFSALPQTPHPVTDRQPQGRLTWSEVSPQAYPEVRGWPIPHPQQLGDDLLADSQLLLLRSLPQSVTGPRNLHLGLLTSPLVFPQHQLYAGGRLSRPPH